MALSDWAFTLGVALASGLVVMALDALVSVRLLKGRARSGLERTILVLGIFTSTVYALTRHTVLGDRVPAWTFMAGWMVIFGVAMKLAERRDAVEPPPTPPAQ